MDVNSIIFDCAIVAADFFILGIIYKTYKRLSTELKAIKEAESFTINKDLTKFVQNQNGIIPYAVISGNVKALATPLNSKYFSSIQGVIHEHIINQRKVKWDSFLHVWTHADEKVQRNIISIPFGLCGDNYSILKKSIVVEIVEPFSAQELELAQVHNIYNVCQNTLGESLIGYISGENTVGISEVENMLLVGKSMTAIGKLVFENGKLKMMPPDNGLTYYVTPLSLEDLNDKIHSDGKLFKLLTFIVCVTSAILLTHLSNKWFKTIKKKIDHARQVKKCEREQQLRRQRLLTTAPNTSDDNNSPKCVVCLENPVEILILECGHACLCLRCSERVDNHCPICRNRVQRFVAAFLP